MHLGTVVNRSVTVRRVLRFLVIKLVELGAQLNNVVLHREAAGALGVVPGEVDACVEDAFFIDGDVLVFAEDVKEVISVAFTHVLCPKIIYG